ncbi:MAG TPA: hypothetical protein VKU39_12050 [Streptosporangiaceae bacterium]|nr:hypothetical protein [Streptosporangiaceae bacterium]
MRQPRTTCPGRALRGRRLDRNPLRRRSDRIETALAALAVIAFLVAAPLAWHAAASWAYAGSRHQASAERAALRQVPALLLENPVSQPVTAYVPVALAQAQARWTAPDGRVVHRAISVADASATVGSTVLIWVDQAGDLSQPPLQQSQIAIRADMAGVAAIAIAGLACVLSWQLGRSVLDRRRLAAWDADWRTTEPRWTTRR